uniref:C2H2-type domain-containing protein n=1 Tax=Trichuris muris TaxID=70415 RepID=A0A5S6Q6I6_TRIMR
MGQSQEKVWQDTVSLGKPNGAEMVLPSFSRKKGPIRASRALSNMIPDEEHAVRFLQENVCSASRWRSTKAQCHKNVAVRKGTWREGARLPLTTIIRFLYAWEPRLHHVRKVIEVVAVTIMEPQDTIVSEDAEIIEIDASQLEEFLAANNGTAEFVDQHGNTIRLTAQELLNAGFAAESLEESSLAGITDVSTYADGSDGGFYVIETGDHEPPRLELVDESSALSENVAKDTDSVDESQSDKPPVLSASVPLRSGERCVPSDAQDVQQLRELYEEYCKELRDKEKKLAAQFSQLKIVEERTLILANALVKNVQWEEAEVYVDAQDVPDSVTATVCVKRPKQNEAPPEDAIVVQLDSGESCFVIAQDLSGQTLRSHGGSTDNEKRNAMLRCDRCPRRFALESELTYHQKNEHPPRFPFYCRYCDKELLFITERDFQAHGRMFHRKQITGEIDTMSIDAVKSEEEEPQWELLEMEKWNEPSNETDRVQGGEHKCTVCFRNFPTAFSASRHVREEHMITDEQRLLTMVVPSRNMDLSISTCEICKRTFSKREFLERHKIAHTDDVPYACKLCPRKFKWQYNLQKHMTTHGSRGNFKCTECNQVFHSQARVDVHYKARHPGRPKDQICPLCEVAFSEKESLAKHMRSHGGSLFPCSECDKKFVDKNFLLRHMFVHTGVKRYVCEVCGKVFSVVEQLAAHKHVHKERKFACDKCEWRFASTADLKRHRKWHDPRYKEVCLKCGSRFRTKEELKAHTEKWHQPRKKRFQCGICTKQFAKIENLTVHVDKHRQICAFPCAKGHRCLVCKESFDTKEEIMRHMFSHMNRRMHYIVVAMKHDSTEAIIVPKPKEQKLEIAHEKAQTIVVGAELQSEALEEKRSDLSFAGLNNPQNVNEDSRGIANDSAPVELLNEGMPLLPEQLINQDISK